jgi:hypothetical protein
MKRTYDYLGTNDAGTHVSIRVRGLVLSVVILLLLVALPLGCASRDNQKHALAIYGPVHVYRSKIPPAVYPGSDFIDTIGPKDHVKVMEVSYRQDYLAVKVRLSDGREGWVFSGESIELHEPHRLGY